MPKKDLIYKYCLQNAIFYNGKADAKSVMGKTMSAEPELRKNASEVKKEIEKQVKEVNKLSLEKQRLELEKIDPKLMIREEKKQEELPSLQGAVKGKVVTRFAPSPTGPLNIAQVLRAAMLNYLIAKKYNGKFLLRIEDTDPRKVERKFIGWIKEDLTKLGIKWDKLIQQSKRLDVYYKKMEELLR